MGYYLKGIQYADICEIGDRADGNKKYRTQSTKFCFRTWPLALVLLLCTSAKLCDYDKSGIAEMDSTQYTEHASAEYITICQTPMISPEARNSYCSFVPYRNGID